MKMIPKISIFFWLILIPFTSDCAVLAKNATSSASTPTKDVCDHNSADRCALEIVPVTDEEFLKNPPNSIQGITKWCKKFKINEDCLKEYASKCFKKETKQTLNIILFAAGKTTKRYCTNSKRKDVLLKIFQCMKDNLYQYNRVMHNITVNFHAIRKYKPANLRVPMACCTYYNQEETALAILQKTCPEIIDEAATLLRSYIADISNVLCGEYTDETDKCQTLMPKIPKWKKPLEWNSFVIPLIEIFDGVE